MITIKSNEEAQKLIKNMILEIDDDLEIAFDDFSIAADIRCRNFNSKDYPRYIRAYDIKAESIEVGDIFAFDIKTGNIKARNIKARNITTSDIKARDIKAVNIKVACHIDAMNIDAENINVGDIDVMNIDAENIIAYRIDANNIEYYAVCCAYKNFKCHSIKGAKENSKHFCLESEIEIVKDEKIKKG